MSHFLANLVLIIHALFILFVLFGGLLAFRYWWIVFWHVPAVIWAILLELNHWICPLTPLENYFRQQAGGHGYQEGFIEHYLTLLIYPHWLTPEIQIVLGAAVALLNLVIYGAVLCRWKQQTRT